MPIKLNLKKFRRAYKVGFQKLWRKQTKENNKLVYKYYKNGFDKSINDFLDTEQVIQGNYEMYFQDEVTQKMFLDIYINTGLKFYNWYINSYQSFIKKEVSSEETMENFITNYVLYSSRLTQKIDSVKKTALKTVVSQFSSVMEDENFLKESRLGKAKILQNKLNGKALWEAKRIVVTETTLASNLGAEKASLTAFKPEELVKDWIIGSSMNHRIGHLDLDAQDPIPMSKDFVNPQTGVAMRIPGEGPASETINCSCQAAFIPNPELLNRQEDDERFIDVDVG